MFVCLLAYLFVCLFACLSVCLFACLFACLFLCLFACLLLCLLVCLCVCKLVCLHACLLLCFLFLPAATPYIRTQLHLLARSLLRTHARTHITNGTRNTNRKHETKTTVWSSFGLTPQLLMSNSKMPATPTQQSCKVGRARIYDYTLLWGVISFAGGVGGVCLSGLNSCQRTCTVDRHTPRSTAQHRVPRHNAAQRTATHLNTLLGIAPQHTAPRHRRQHESSNTYGCAPNKHDDMQLSQGTKPFEFFHTKTRP